MNCDIHREMLKSRVSEASRALEERPRSGVCWKFGGGKLDRGCRRKIARALVIPAPTVKQTNAGVHKIPRFILQCIQQIQNIQGWAYLQVISELVYTRNKKKNLPQSPQFRWITQLLGIFFASSRAFSVSTAEPFMTPVAAITSSLETGGPVKCLRAYTKYQMILIVANPANTTLA